MSTMFPPDVNLEGLLPPDGIDPFAENGVPPGFDLGNLLSESMRARQPWGDLARVTSKVLYEYVERTRIALELSREPENLARVLRIVTLKMLGLDWRSDKLTDDDYERILHSISLYQQGHGPQDFVRFMGYALGVPMDFMKLWTKNYEDFHPGPQWGDGVVYGREGGIGMNRHGPWYPTTHVAMLYEEFSTNVAKIDEQALTDLFYRMAPINLVLEYIASEVTLRLNLLMATKFFEGSSDTILANGDPKLTLLVSEAHYESSVDTIITEPSAPKNELDFTIAVSNQDEGHEYAIRKKPGVFWEAGDSLSAGGLSLSSSNIEVPSKSAQGVEQKSIADPSFRDFAGNEGLLINAARYCAIPNGGNPGAASWVRTIGFNVGYATVLSGLIATPVTITNRASIATTTLDATSCAARWTIRRTSGATCCAISVNAQLIVVDLIHGTLVQSAANAAVENLGGGWYSIRFNSTGQVTFYPAWGEDAIGSSTALGAYQWYAAQFEKGYVYPTVAFKSGSSSPYLLAPNAVTLGKAEQMNYNYGFLLLDAVPWYSEWLYAEQILLGCVSSNGDHIEMYVGADALPRLRGIAGGITLSSVASAITAGVPFKTAIAWDRPGGTLRWYFAGTYLDFNGRLPSNLYQVAAFRGVNSPSTSTWVMRRAIMLGSSDPTIADHDLLTSLTS